MNNYSNSLGTQHRILSSLKYAGGRCLSPPAKFKYFIYFYHTSLAVCRNGTFKNYNQKLTFSKILNKHVKMIDIAIPTAYLLDSYKNFISQKLISKRHLWWESRLTSRFSYRYEYNKILQSCMFLKESLILANHVLCRCTSICTTSTSLLMKSHLLHINIFIYVHYIVINIFDLP